MNGKKAWRSFGVANSIMKRRFTLRAMYVFNLCQPTVSGTIGYVAKKPTANTTLTKHWKKSVAFSTSNRFDAK